MLLRIFLKIIKPTDSLINKKSRTKLEAIWITVYQYFFKSLLKSYSHYAIFDIVAINSNIKIVHEFRDREFEQELTRNKIKFNLKPSPTTLPSISTKNTHNAFYAYFRFKDLLVLYVDDKELFIRHDGEYMIDGNVKCKIKTASDINALTQSSIEIETNIIQNEAQNNKDIVTPRKTTKEKPMRKSGGLFSKDNTVTSFGSEIAETKDTVTVKDPVHEVIGKKGFEIDSLF